MDHLSPSKRFLLRLAGIVYALLHAASQRRFLGVTVAGWLKNLPLLVAIVALFRGMSILWILAGLGLAILVRLVFWRAKRNGYVQFATVESEPAGAAVKELADNEKLAVLATGLFSVSRLEAYVLQRPAQYWRTPAGDHGIMVEHMPGRYLYQFVEVGSLESVKPGILFLGRRSRPGLALTFWTDWKPESIESSLRQLRGGPRDNPGKIRRTVTITFEGENERLVVWRSLLHRASQEEL